MPLNPRQEVKRAGRVKAPVRGLKRFLFSYINVELYRGRGEGEAGEEGRWGEAGGRQGRG